MVVRCGGRGRLVALPRRYEGAEIQLLVGADGPHTPFKGITGERPNEAHSRRNGVRKGRSFPLTCSHCGLTREIRSERLMTQTNPNWVARAIGPWWRCGGEATTTRFNRIPA